MFSSLDHSKKVRLVAVAVIVVVGLLFAGGGMTGFFLAGEQTQSAVANLTAQVEQLQTDVAALQQEREDLGNLLAGQTKASAEYKQQSEDLQQQLDAKDAEIAAKETELKKAQDDLAKAQQDVAAAQQAKTAAELNLQIEQQHYSDLGANNARDICCVRQVFDKTIQYYYVESDKIVCTNDSAKTAFTC